MLMKKYTRYLLLAMVFYVSTLCSLQAQVNLNWEDLATDLNYIEQYNEEYDLTYNQPIFSPKMMMLNGEEVTIKGYVLPLDVEGSYFVLSKLPYSSCFFCSKDKNKAGPETVIELKLDDNAKKQYQMDDIVTFKGKLYLNDTDMHQLYYVLKKARPIR